MDTIRELATGIRREKLERARRMPPEEKILAGEELFRWASDVSLSGIRRQNPNLTEEQALEVLRKRLANKSRRDRVRAD